MKNRIKELFEKKQERILNVYFTAGHPSLDSLLEIVPALESAGADIIEVGMPYSDPLADGPTIQESSSLALANGMNLDLLFKQIKQVRETSSIPIILMGYFNQMLQFGVDRFLETASASGVDGLIIPDLPMEIYEKDYAASFAQHNLSISFLVSPQTEDARIAKAASLSSAFLYVVSQSSITGGKGSISASQEAYFEKVNRLKGASSSLIGFGIHDKKTFDQACSFANGAIIGSAFIRALAKSTELKTDIKSFVESVKGKAKSA